MNKLTLRILRAAAQRPLAALLVAAALPAVVASAALVSRRAEVASAATPQGNEREVLGRVWFDKYPEKATDVMELWIWFGGGVGFHEKGSRYRAWMDFFEFERQGNKLTMTTLHDKKELVRSFTVARCDDAPPPFDLCLTLDEKLGGQKRYYGFAYDDEMDAKIPWARSIVKSAEARAAGPR